MRLHVNQFDINHGTNGNPTSCPIARCLKRLGYNATVDRVAATFDGRSYSLPKKAKDFVRNFDAGVAVRPISFSI